MKNPFSDFQSVSAGRRRLPLMSILHAKETILLQLSLGFTKLIEDEVAHLFTGEGNGYLFRIYQAALQKARELQYDSLDIEDYLVALDPSTPVPFPQVPVAEIYLAALINHAREERLRLSVMDCRRTFHFLGYRLPQGKTLVIEGEAGNFTGAFLAGGSVIVKGSSGDYCGAGMIQGEVVIQGPAGRHLGNWMRGGEIRVSGSLGSIGKEIFGGKIFQQGKLLKQR
jgi:hypothetical protein